MSKRNDILTTLKTDLETNITVANGYSANLVEVFRGIYNVDETSVLPAVSFWCYEDVITKQMLKSKRQRYLQILMRLYASNKGDGAIVNIHNLVDDVETFLYNTEHWTYSDDTLLGPTTQIWEGGIQDPNSLAALDFKILYFQD